MRAAQVATVSARAQTCGLGFDEAKLKASYLRYEAAQSAGGAQLAAIEKSYDATRAEILRTMGSEPAVCSAKQIADSRADIQRYIAGYFTPRRKAAPSDEYVADAFPVGSQMWWEQNAREGPDRPWAQRKFETLSNETASAVDATDCRRSS